MNRINKLGLYTALIAGLATILVFGMYWGAKKIASQSHQNTINSHTGPSLEELTANNVPDQDGDGLPDLFEKSFNTDPANPDTDNDGTNDAEELAIGRDPTIAAPNDESKPAIAGDITDTSTYTGRYLSQLPANATREDILNPDRLEAFIELNQGSLLPEVSVTTTASTGRDAIAEYLASISANHTEELTRITNDDIQTAFAALLELEPEPMNNVIVQLEHNIETLKKVSAPSEVADLHQQLVAATTALLESTKLLQNIENDFVGSLIGTKKIDELGSVFQEIAAQVSELESKYDLEDAAV